MGLPKIDQPLFTLTLPSTGKEIKYRPFTVKEEKILLIAQESDEVDQALTAVKQVVNNCLIDIDVDKLAMFDLEYILLNLRSKSVDNNITFSIQDPDTEEKIQLEMDLNEVSISWPENHTNQIKINDDYILIMRYPSVNEFFILVKEGIENHHANFEIMMNCMDQLVSEDEVYKFEDFEDKEIESFIDSLTSDIIHKIKNFFETMPKLRHEIPYTNSDGKKQTFVIEGVQTFFI